MDDSAAVTSLAFLAAGTLFTMALGSIVLATEEYDPKLTDQTSDLAAQDLINAFVRPYGSASGGPLDGGSSQQPSSSTSSSSSSSSSTPLPLTTPSPSSSGSSTTTGSAASSSGPGVGCDGKSTTKCKATFGCDKGNLEKNRKQCAAEAEVMGPPAPPAPTSSGTSSSASTSSTSTSTSQSGSATSSGSGSTSSTGSGSSSSGKAAGRQGLSVRSGVLNLTKVMGLVPGPSTTGPAGSVTYQEARDRLGYKTADFRLVFTKVTGANRGVLMDFGSPRAGNEVSMASAYFCWGSCADGTVRVDAVVVR